MIFFHLSRSAELQLFIERGIALGNPYKYSCRLSVARLALRSQSVLSRLKYRCDAAQGSPFLGVFFFFFVWGYGAYRSFNLDEKILIAHSRQYG